LAPLYTELVARKPAQCMPQCNFWLLRIPPPPFPQISLVRDFSYGKGPTRCKLLQLSPRKQLGRRRFPKPSAKIMIYLAGIIAKIVCAVALPPPHTVRGNWPYFSALLELKRNSNDSLNTNF
jgi:hypothetical protein